MNIFTLFRNFPVGNVNKSCDYIKFDKKLGIKRIKGRERMAATYLLTWNSKYICNWVEEGLRIEE